MDIKDRPVDGFRITTVVSELPRELTSRDLWNGWHTAIRYGRQKGAGYVFQVEHIWIIIEKLMEKEYLGIALCPKEGNLIQDLIMCQVAPIATLANGIDALWDFRLSVREVRGVIV